MRNPVVYVLGAVNGTAGHTQPGREHLRIGWVLGWSAGVGLLVLALVAGTNALRVASPDGVAPDAVSRGATSATGMVSGGTGLVAPADVGGPRTGTTGTTGTGVTDWHDVKTAAGTLYMECETLIRAMNNPDQDAVGLARDRLARDSERLASALDGAPSVPATRGEGAQSGPSGYARAALSYIQSGLAEHDVAYLARAKWLLQEAMR